MFKESTDDPPDTHSRFWVASAARFTIEFINNLNVVSLPENMYE